MTQIGVQIRDPQRTIKVVQTLLNEISSNCREMEPQDLSSSEEEELKVGEKPGVKSLKEID
jgi:hypothetical protein